MLGKPLVDVTKVWQWHRLMQRTQTINLLSTMLIPEFFFLILTRIVKSEIRQQRIYSQLSDHRPT